MMHRRLIAALAAIGLVAAAPASAETLEVTWSIFSSGETFTLATWDQDSAPTPVFSVGGIVTEVAVSDFVSYFPGIPISTSIFYFASGLGATFSTVFDDGFGQTGGQAYTGSEATPQFAPGSFSGLAFVPGGPPSDPSTLTFAIPEPSTWALMLAGFAGVGAMSFGMRRRAAPV
jgi:PEP-CTERM motif